MKFNKVLLFEELQNQEATQVRTADKSTAVTDKSNNVKIDSDSRREAIKDVDSILLNLKKLSASIVEDIESVENSNETSIIEDLANSIFYISSYLYEETAVNEEGGMKTAIDFMIRAPKARKAQDKVNKLKLKIAGIESAMDSASSDVKAKLKGKVDMMKAQSKDLQSSVNDRWDDKGEIVKKAKQSEKIKGDLSVLKTAMGEEGADKGELKKTAANLKARLSDEEAALKDMEPSDKEQEDAVTQLKKEKEAKEKEAEEKAKEKEAEEKAKDKGTSGKDEGTSGTSGKDEGTSGTSGKDEGTSGKDEGTSGTSGKDEGTSGSNESVYITESISQKFARLMNK